MQKLIDADAFERAMYEEAFEKDTDMQRWDSGCWIRYKLYERVLDAQPIVDAEPHWIPCSERMPNDDKDYLVTDGESMAVGYYRTDAKAWDNVNFGWLEHREETCGLKPVVAWMPLPKPYEVEE